MDIGIHHGMRMLLRYRLSQWPKSLPGYVEDRKKRRPVEGADAKETKHEESVGLSGSTKDDDHEEHIYATCSESKWQVWTRSRGEVGIHDEKCGRYTQKMHVVNCVCPIFSLGHRMSCDP